MNIKLLKAQYQLVTENGYTDPVNSECEPVITDKFEYMVDFFDCQVFVVEAYFKGGDLNITSIELINDRGVVLMKIDPEYWLELLNINIVKKIYKTANEHLGY